MWRTIQLGTLLVLTTTIAIAQQSGWQWINPLPQGNIVNGISAVNKDTAVAVAEFGTILRTYNGGSTWQVVPNAGGITEQLYATQFITGTVGWAVGEYGRILKTTDGGATWTIQSVSTFNDLFAMHFVSSTTGWVGGGSGTILKTTNGGTTWLAQTSTTTTSLYGIHFISSTTGWVVGGNGTILKTTNGGTAWTKQTTGTTQSLYSVYFTSSSNGFAVGSFGLILGTNNGGTTWTPRTSGTSLSLFAVQFTSSLVGWTVGAYGIVLKTTNGGTLWIEQNSKTYNDLWGMRFVSSSIGWAVGDYGTMITTTDGGTTWKLQSTGVQKVLYASDFPTTTYGWAVGEEGAIVFSQDGGMTWREQSSGLYQTLYGIHMINSTQGWAVGDSAVILRTSDAGFSWHEQNSHTDISLYSVYFASATTGWAVGDFGTILHTSNGGVSWKMDTVNTFATLLKVQFFNPSIGWVVGYDGAILKTTNGGTTWTEQFSGTSQTLYAISIVDANTVFVTGDFGTVLHTTNGGQTWDEAIVDSYTSFYGIAFLNASTGWVVGDEGAIAKTTDSGVSWSFQNSGTYRTLWDLHLVGTSSGGGILLAMGGNVGDAGSILLYSTISPLPMRRWTGALDSLWTSGINWDPIGVPDKTDSVYIPVTLHNPVHNAPAQQVNVASLRIAAGAKFTVRRGVTQLVVKSGITIDGALEVDPASSVQIIAGKDFIVDAAGQFTPGNSTVLCTGAGSIRGSFYNLFLAESSAMSSYGNMSVKNVFTSFSTLSLRQYDTLSILSPEPQAIQGTGIITAGSVRRAIRPASTEQYRFESPVSYVQFYPTGTLPDTLLVTTYPRTVPPGQIDTNFVHRYYSVLAKGGSNYLFNLSLRYDTSETRIPIDDLAFFRDSATVVMNMGATDFLDSDLVAIELDSVRGFSNWYFGKMDLIPVHPMQYTDSLIIRDNGGVTDTLVFGAAPFATNGVDSAFDEVVLGPKPPTGTFDARWSIPPTNGTLIDIRDILSSGHLENVYTFTVQPGAGGYPITLRWNPSVYPMGSMTLRDQATQGGQFSINMRRQNSYIITNPGISAAQIVHHMPPFYSFARGWNMISLPATPILTNKKRDIFPTAISRAFYYSASYRVADTLTPGVGYWLKFAGSESIPIDGDPRSVDTIDVAEGWNLIGTISSPVPINQVGQIPADIVRSKYYGYATSYRSRDTLVPAQAYWVKTRTAGKLVMSASGAMDQEPRMSKPDELLALNTLSITEREGSNQTLYFGRPSNPTFSPDEYELPPLPPDGIFDARFSSNRLAEVLPDSGKAILVSINSAAYPITVQWNIQQPHVQSISISDAKTGKRLGVSAGSRDGSVQISDPSVTSIALRATTSDAVPKEFALRQNYPNPFNPTTKIEFDLPGEAVVTLKVFNLLGQEVTRVVDEQLFVAGSHALSWNGSNFGSGVYFYQITAKVRDKKHFQAVKKMLLIK